jgi:SAM-dependent methyltransferase
MRCRMQNAKASASTVEALKEQYKDSSNFRKRTALHARFGTNRYSFYRWVFDQFDLANVRSILELGCGPGSLWQQNIDRLPRDSAIVVSDFSAGMVREARANIGASAGRLQFCQLDASALPFKPATLDAIVAMLMLYHVDDRPTALRGIRSALRTGGTLYASTMGYSHLRELREIASRVFGPERLARSSERFGLETGYDQLKAVFANVEVRRYESSMRVTEAQPVIDYFLSTSRMRQIPAARMEAVRQELEREITRQNGGIAVTTDLGLLIAN